MSTVGPKKAAPQCGVHIQWLSQGAGLTVQYSFHRHDPRIQSVSFTVAGSQRDPRTALLSQSLNLESDCPCHHPTGHCPSPSHKADNCAFTSALGLLSVLDAACAALGFGAQQSLREGNHSGRELEQRILFWIHNMKSNILTVFLFGRLPV